jgi:hypothetical protein
VAGLGLLQVLGLSFEQELQEEDQNCGVSPELELEQH